MFKGRQGIFNEYRWIISRVQWLLDGNVVVLLLFLICWTYEEPFQSKWQALGIVTFIIIDFQGAKITSDVGFLLMREIDDRFKIIAPMGDCLEDLRSPAHTKHSLVQMIGQRVYQIAASYEDCNDADFLRRDPALSLALDD